MLVTSIFSFSNNVLYTSKAIFLFFRDSYFVFYKSCQFGQVPKLTYSKGLRKDGKYCGKCHETVMHVMYLFQKIKGTARK